MRYNRKYNNNNVTIEQKGACDITIVLIYMCAHSYCLRATIGNKYVRQTSIKSYFNSSFTLFIKTFSEFMESLNKIYTLISVCISCYVTVHSQCNMIYDTYIHKFLIFDLRCESVTLTNYIKNFAWEDQSQKQCYILDIEPDKAVS